jgi:hypothetical protein
MIVAGTINTSEVLEDGCSIIYMITQHRIPETNTQKYNEPPFSQVSSPLH